MREETKRIAEKFQCEYQVFEKGSKPKELEAAYYEALKEGMGKGFYPAILVLDDIVTEWAEDTWEGDYDKEKVISECGDNGKELLQEWFGAFQKDCMGNSEEALEELIGDETQGEEIHHFNGYISFRDRKLEADTLLLKIPAKNPWEIAAWLPLGGWNEYPGPEDMTAVCKYWYEAYGAFPAVFTHDVVEFYAPKRLNGADSLAVAKEHFAFCQDRVFQGTATETVSELAAGLEDSEVWYFWWD